MNVPQINASAITGQLETNVSLGAVHIDFSLIKVQPPTEFRGLGDGLSRRRNKEAEDGQTHAAASKLGVLFDGVIPAVPHLIRAYGSRCSEIAQSPVFNPKGNKTSHGLFADQVGADGTTIWAAATSGSASIAVHLLACMLARIWDSPMAISIWMEMIATRKEKLAASGKPIDYHASNISLTRDEVSNWDASARAWRLTADQANEKRQKQLILIIDHLGLPVGTKMEASENVIEAWTVAMITVDKLVAGEGQMVQIASPLLGLAAWHLYPDMLVLGRSRGGEKLVKQNDRLILKGGLLTLGLEDSRRHGEGIYWSLPLAHLKYYGDPVQAEARLSTQTSRVTIEQLLYVAIGSLVRRWCTNADDMVKAITMLVQLHEFLEETSTGWLRLLASAAHSYLSSSVERQAELLQLLKCGRRRFPTLVDSVRIPSIFGLSDPNTMLQLMPNNEARVELLRNVAKDFGGRRQLMLIQCDTQRPLARWELASAGPLFMRKSASNERIQYRWLNNDHEDFDPQNRDLYLARTRATTIRLDRDERIPHFGTRQGYTWSNPPASLCNVICQAVDPNGNWERAKEFSLTTRLLSGEPRVAALYAISITYWKTSQNIDPVTIEDRDVRALPNIFMLRHVTLALAKGWVERKLLLQYFMTRQLPLSHQSAATSQQLEEKEQWEELCLRPLRALATLCNLYQDLPNANIELKAASKPLAQHQWVPSMEQHSFANPFAPFNMDLDQTFACIARFESGQFNVSSSAMKGVFAIASGNSLFVARCLLQDPNSKPSGALVERVVGNIGRSGMAMLIAPQKLKVRDILVDYRLVNHHKFDGIRADSFSSTTLHMSFTDWRLPLDVGSRGIRDVEAYYIEAPIGVHNHEDWVADVNILDIFRHNKSRILPNCNLRHDVQISDIELSQYVTIDNWEELLDYPPEVGVVRAHNNWQARLAAAALALQRGHEVRILPSTVCWTCATGLPAMKKSNNDHDLDEEEDDDVIAAPERPMDESCSDSEIDDELERHRSRRPTKRLRLEDWSPMDVSPIRRTDRNIVYIY